jgi:outer membrane protein assembly factor BamB
VIGSRIGRMMALMASVLCASLDAQEAAVGYRRDGTGLYPDAKPPMRWSTKDHVLWSTPIPPSFIASSVVPIADRVFCCCDPDSLLCLDAATGRILWSRPNPISELATSDQLALIRGGYTEGQQLRARISEIDQQRQPLRAQLDAHPDDQQLRAKIAALDLENTNCQARMHPLAGHVTDNDHSASFTTPVSDGRNVWAVFGSGVVACYDLDGKRIWSRFLESPIEHHGQRSSPVLVGGKLLVCLNDQFGLDPASGRTEWRIFRRVTMGTPLPMTMSGEAVALMPYGDVVRARDGRILAAGDASDYWSMWFQSPIVHDGVAYFIDLNGRAMRLQANAEGAIDPELLWTFSPPANDGNNWQAPPVFCDGRICTAAAGELFAFAPETGKVAYRRKLSSAATPAEHAEFCVPLALAGGKLFVSTSEGRTWVLDPADGYAEVACNLLEPIGWAPPVFSGERMYLRTAQAVYCIGERP